MLDVTDQLRHYADAVTDTVDAVRPDDVGSVTLEPTRRRRPRWPALAAIAAAVVLIAGGLWLVANAADEQSPDPSSPPPSITTGPRSGIEMLDPGPLAPRADAAVVWTGDELMIWGGDIEAFNQGLPGPDRQFADGAAYNPATRTWRKLGVSPLPASTDTPVAAMTDRGVVIARGTKVALWHPKTDTWKRVDDAPGNVGQLVLAGDEVLSADANAALDLTTGHWRTFPAPPTTLGRQVGAWTGSELVVVGQRSFYDAGAMAFDPEANTWRQLADPPELNPAALSVASDGDRSVFVDYEMHVVAFQHGSGEWEILPPVPARFYEYQPTIDAVPPALIVRTADAISVLGAYGPWTPLPIGELAFWSSEDAVAPGDDTNGAASLFVYGLTRAGEPRFARIEPERMAEAARILHVGVVDLHLPDGVTVLHSEYDSTTGREQTLVELTVPTGTCVVTSTYGLFGDVGGWTQSDSSGDNWFAQATDSDGVGVSCPDPATAKRITEAITFPDWSNPERAETG